MERELGDKRISTDRTGRARLIQSRDGTRIVRGLHPGDRVVERRDAGGRRVVSLGHDHGFTERAFTHHGGHDYVQRTYLYGGRRYAYAYRTYYWGGSPYYSYAPCYYYRPAFYGWAYNPWVSPVYYDWGWGASPWYGYYGSYFTVAPLYPTAAFWLTDFVLGASLEIAYAEQQQAASAPPDYGYANPETDYSASEATPLSPEVKQAIAMQVQQDLAAEREAAAQPASDAPDYGDGQPAEPGPASSDNGPPPVLDPSISVFVVSYSLAVSTADGRECELTPGDVLGRIDNEPGDDNALAVRVSASKKGDCPAGSTPRVQVADLQEMHNQFRQQVDTGLKTLAAGGPGLPAPPDTGTQEVLPAPQPDDAAGQLQDLQREADQTEREVNQPAQ